MNPDLDDIAATYADATVLVAWLGQRLWHEVIAFYEAAGVRLTHYEDSRFGREAYFALELAGTQQISR